MPDFSSAAVEGDSLADEQLLLRYRDTRDADLFALLVRRYEAELYNYLYRYLGHAQMAEDVFQATFLQLHLKCDQFEPDRRVRPWLYTIATNQAIDAQRRNRRHKATSLDQVSSGRTEDSGRLMDLLVSEEGDPSDALATEENRIWLRRQLADLPDHLRSVVLLVYFQGLKYREAAEVLSVPVGTVKSRLHAAVSKLNEAWYTNQPQQS